MNHKGTEGTEERRKREEGRAKLPNPQSPIPQSPIPYSPLPITHYQLPITNYPLPHF